MPSVISIRNLSPIEIPFDRVPAPLNVLEERTFSWYDLWGTTVRWGGALFLASVWGATVFYLRKQSKTM